MLTENSINLITSIVILVVRSLTYNLINVRWCDYVCESMQIDCSSSLLTHISCELQQWTAQALVSEKCNLPPFQRHAEVQAVFFTHTTYLMVCARSVTKTWKSKWRRVLWGQQPHQHLVATTIQSTVSYWCTHLDEQELSDFIGSRDYHEGIWSRITISQSVIRLDVTSEHYACR